MYQLVRGGAQNRDMMAVNSLSRGEDSTCHLSYILPSETLGRAGCCGRPLAVCVPKVGTVVAVAGVGRDGGDEESLVR